ncbi:hypothetical protein IDH44_11075 [Paenibacillus sp. IB182496]|uniref:Uncharacterized protein n=1 Tax=Paenibacillus sabuli TaxID=2772509 RepID=A0A927GRP9_9BACL|nr:hypothetical protein [Paenibacillus sabuli]MBD2845733.1 hypothetical protein [Paenibacillus sabuli]
MRKPVAIGIAATLVATAALAALLWLGLEAWRDSAFYNMTRPFTVMLHNDTSASIADLQAGVVSGLQGSRLQDAYDEPIATGERTVWRPQLTLRGEGSIFIAYTDAEGERVTVSIDSICMLESAQSYHQNPYIQISSASDQRSGRVPS